jgi:hypothetical protein
MRPYLEINLSKKKKGLVEWLKVYTLSLSPSIGRKKKKKYFL